MFDVFLSHNSADKPLVRQLRDRLQQASLTTWMDEDNLTAGQPWVEGIERGLMSSRAIIIAVGTSGMGPWETPEMNGALIHQPKRDSRLFARSGLFPVPFARAK